MAIQPQEIARYFTNDEGAYFFARWNRPIAPVVFGVEDATITMFKDAIKAVCHLAGLELAEVDPELGSNFMLFFVRDWGELLAVPDLDRLIDNLPEVVGKLTQASAHQYRSFRFDDDGGIQAAFVFVRMDKAMSRLPAETICLAQAVQSILVWSRQSFSEQSPLGVADGHITVVKPEIGSIIRAAYDPAMPVYANDESHALRLAARVGLGFGEVSQ